MPRKPAPLTTRRGELKSGLRFLALRLRLGQYNAEDLMAAGSFLEALAEGETLDTLSGTRPKAGRPSLEYEDFAIACRVEQLKLSPEQIPELPWGKKALGLSASQAWEYVSGEQNDLRARHPQLCQRPYYTSEIVRQAWQNYRAAAEAYVNEMTPSNLPVVRPDEDVENSG